MLRAVQRGFSFLVLASCAIVPAADGGARDASRDTKASVNPIRGEDHYVMRDGLRIYFWEKHKAGLESTFANNGKVALLIHGGTWSGRPLFDLQIRDYSLMDFLAEFLRFPHDCLDSVSRHSFEACQKCPLILVRTEFQIDKNTVSLCTRNLLQRQSDQVAKTSHGHRLLVGEESVV